LDQQGFFMAMVIRDHGKSPFLSKKINPLRDKHLEVVIHSVTDQAAPVIR